MIKNLTYDLVRELFMILDTIVYGLIATIYNLIENVTHYRLFADGDFITNKVYAILSIFMLFKVSFSFINYLINPDSMTDKEKGVQHVVKNIIIMFAMLVMAPWAFGQIWGLQDAILSENVLAQFVFGDQNTRIQNEVQMWDICDELGTSKSVASTNGDYIALMTLRTFYKPYQYEQLGHSVQLNTWKKALQDEGICNDVSRATPINYLNPKTVVAFVDDGVTWNGLADEDLYLMDYTVLISTAVGIVVLLILVSFAMDVGLRLVKLSFLQLIAPIPIVSFIDPSSSKNGMFIKWLKEVGATWASVFIRLFALFFGVRVIQEVGAENGGLTPIDSKYPDADMWVMLIVIIGALMFAKQLPKLITDLTGIKMDGGFNLNPMKKFKDEALGAKAITGTIGGATAGGIALAGGMAANAWAANKNNAKIKKDLAAKGINSTDKNFRREFKNAGGATALGYARTMAAGGASSAVRAMAKSKDGNWHPIKNAAGGIKDSSKARNLRAKGYGADDKIKDYVTDVAGIKFSTGTTSQLKEKVNILEQELANARRNEQAMSNAFEQRISEMGNLTAGLLKTFDNAADKYDSKGNISAYKVKTYEQYAEGAAKLEAINAGEVWENLDEIRRNIYISQAEYNGTIVDRATFDSLNTLYEARNKQDLAGKKIERDINDLKSDMEKFNGRKGK